MSEGLVMKAGPITVAELAELLAKLPPATKVQRIDRDNREELMSWNAERCVYQGTPQISIHLELPEYTRIAPTETA